MQLTIHAINEDDNGVLEKTQKRAVIALNKENANSALRLVLNAEPRRPATQCPNILIERHKDRNQWLLFVHPHGDDPDFIIVMTDDPEAEDGRVITGLTAVNPDVLPDSE